MRWRAVEESKSNAFSQMIREVHICNRHVRTCACSFGVIIGLMTGSGAICKEDGADPPHVLCGRPIFI